MLSSTLRLERSVSIKTPYLSWKIVLDDVKERKKKKDKRNAKCSALYISHVYFPRMDDVAASDFFLFIYFYSDFLYFRGFSSSEQ